MLELGTSQSGHLGSTAHTPATLKGFLTRRIFILIDRLVLADECNRPNCQRRTSRIYGSHYHNGFCDPEEGGLSLAYHLPTPSAGATLPYGICPGRRLHCGY